MAAVTVDELVNTGTPFNPASGDDGQVGGYSRKNADTLKAAMVKNGWTDPRFVTEAQAEKMGCKLAPEAKPSLVLTRNYDAAAGESPWVRHYVYNAGEVVGLPPLEVTVALAKGDASLETLVKGRVPCSIDGKMYTGEFAKALNGAMQAHEFDDPRFVSAVKVAQMGLSAGEDAQGFTVTYKDGDKEKASVMFNASQVAGIVPLSEALVEDAVNRRAASGHGSMRDLVEAGVAFNPLLGENGQGKAFKGRSQDMLQTFMKAEGLTDPRFVTQGQVGQQVNWSLAEGAKEVSMTVMDNGAWRTVPLVNASQVIGMPALEVMLTDAEALAPESIRRMEAKEDRKVVEMASMKAAVAEKDAAAVAGLEVVSTGTTIGKVLNVTSTHVVQQSGPLTTVAHLISALDKVPEKDDTITVRYKNRQGTVKVDAKEAAVAAAPEKKNDIDIENTECQIISSRLTPNGKPTGVALLLRCDVLINRNNDLRVLRFAAVSPEEALNTLKTYSLKDIDYQLEGMTPGRITADDKQYIADYINNQKSKKPICQSPVDAKEAAVAAAPEKKAAGRGR